MPGCRTVSSESGQVHVGLVMNRRESEVLRFLFCFEVLFFFSNALHVIINNKLAKVGVDKNPINKLLN